MIAQACIATHLPPEAFGVTSSPELGDVMLDVLLDQSKASRLDALKQRLSGR